MFIYINTILSVTRCLGPVLKNALFLVIIDIIMSEDMEDLKERFWNWNNALESKGLKVNTRKTKLMVSGSEGELYKSKIDEDVGRESSRIQCCAQNVEAGFMANVQK